eukprot:2361470-Pleurochrysis_carterae.AAC.2
MAREARWKRERECPRPSARRSREVESARQRDSESDSGRCSQQGAAPHAQRSSGRSTAHRRTAPPPAPRSLLHALDAALTQLSILHTFVTKSQHVSFKP